MSHVVGFTSRRSTAVMPAPGQPDRTRCWDRDTVVADGGPMATLQLVDSVATTTGVPVATHQPTQTDGRNEHRV